MTAEKVKSKLQSLLTASNAKTGKSDANLTDAVKTLIDGYGQGGGGECSGKHIIEVDTLPEVGEEGKIYGIPAFKDVFLVMGEDRILYSPMGNAEGMTVGCTTATSTTMVKIDAQMVFYYLTDIPDIYFSMIGGEAESFGAMLGGMLFKGEITDTANATEDGYYAYMGRDFYKYTNGVYAPLIEQGSFIFTSNGDGTCTIIGLNPPYAVHIEIPTTSPQGDIVTGLGNSPTYAGLFNKRAIKSVIIPSTITNISAYVFYDCLMLNNIIFKGTVEQWNAITFSSSTSWKTNVPATKVVCSDGEVTL